MSDETGDLLVVHQPTRTFTGSVASSETVYAGSFVKSESSDDVVTSTGVAGLADGDITVSAVNNTNDYKLVVGYAIGYGTDGDAIGVAMDGIIVCQGSSVTAGAPVMCVTGANTPYTVTDVTAGNEHYKVGTALTGTSADNKYCVVAVNI